MIRLGDTVYQSRATRARGNNGTVAYVADAGSAEALDATSVARVLLAEGTARGGAGNAWWSSADAVRHWPAKFGHPIQDIARGLVGLLERQAFWRDSFQRSGG